MELIIVGLILALVYRHKYGERPKGDGLGRVLGETHEYAECPVCGEANTQVPRGRGEVISRGGSWVVRQYHICSNCNSRALWHRRLDLWVWTVQRSGVPR